MSDTKVKRTYTWRDGDADAPTDAKPPRGFPAALLYFNSGEIGDEPTGFADLYATVEPDGADETVSINIEVEAYAPTAERAEALARAAWDRILGHLPEKPDVAATLPATGYECNRCGVPISADEFNGTPGGTEYGGIWPGGFCASCRAGEQDALRAEHIADEQGRARDLDAQRIREAEDLAARLEDENGRLRGALELLGGWALSVRLDDNTPEFMEGLAEVIAAADVALGNEAEAASGDAR